MTIDKNNRQIYFHRYGIIMIKYSLFGLSIIRIFHYYRFYFLSKYRLSIYIYYVYNMYRYIDSIINLNFLFYCIKINIIDILK